MQCGLTFNNDGIVGLEDVFLDCGGAGGGQQRGSGQQTSGCHGDEDVLTSQRAVSH